MKVTLDRTFPMPAGADVTWTMLEDIEAVASCMPGAAITERLDDRHYKGTVTVKVGPATLKFRGDIEVLAQDAAKRTLRLAAKGTDTSGTSVASMDLTARIEAAGDSRSNLAGHAEASVGGKAATFGGRMMDAVADQILKQFAANFAARAESHRPPAAPPGREGAAAVEPSIAPTPAPPPAKPLHAFALLWAVIRDWWRGRFAKKTA